MKTQHQQAVSRFGSMPQLPIPATGSAALFAVGGVVAERWLALDPALLWLAATTMLLSWLVSSFRGINRGLLVLGSISFASAAWGGALWSYYDGQDLGRYARAVGKPVAVEGIVRQRPELIPAPPATPYRAIPVLETTRIELEIKRLRDGAVWVPAAGFCSLSVSGRSDGLRAGDVVRVFAQLRNPAQAMNPGQRDPAADARTQRRLCTLRADTPKSLRILDAEAGAWWWRRGVDAARDAILGTLHQHLNTEQAELTAAMVFGRLEGLKEETTRAFQTLGLTHVLVVSGMHVSIVAAMAIAVLRVAGAPRTVAAAAVIAATLGYATLAGGGPAVLRATVLAQHACVAALVGRKSISWSALGAAALVVLAINPAEIFRPGAQLSFLCAAVLLGYTQWLAERPQPDALDRLLESVRWWPERAVRWGWLGCYRLGIATLLVQLVATPLVLHHFHLLSLAALPINVASTPLVVLLTGAGAGLAGVAELESSIGWGGLLVSPLAFSCSTLVDLLLGLVAWGVALPGSHAWTPAPDAWWVVGFYAAIALGFVGWRLTGVRRFLLFAAPVWLAAAFLPGAVRESFRSNTVVDFLSVGHGACVVVRPPGGGVLIYDAGALATPEVVGETVSRFLWSRGVRKIDALVISHADIDHFNAVPTLLERFAIGRVLVSPWMLPPFDDPQDRTAPADLNRRLAAHGVQVQRLELGDLFRVGGLSVEVLHPPSVGEFETDNAASLTLGLEHRGVRVLLPGDLEGEGIEALLAQEPYPCDVLMAPHHGSPRSDPPGFAAWCRPKHVVLSAALEDTSAEVRASYQSTGAQVFDLAETGAATCELGSQLGAVRLHRP